MMSEEIAEKAPNSDLAKDVRNVAVPAFGRVIGRLPSCFACLASITFCAIIVTCFLLDKASDLVSQFLDSLTLSYRVEGAGSPRFQL